MFLYVGSVYNNIIMFKPGIFGAFFSYVESCLCGQSPEQDTESQDKFVTLQLLTLMGVVDLSDEVGR